MVFSDFGNCEGNNLNIEIKNHYKIHSATEDSFSLAFHFTCKKYQFCENTSILVKTV